MRAFGGLRIGDGRLRTCADVCCGCSVRALVEQRLQTELVGERRAFLDRCIDDELEVM